MKHPSLSMPTTIRDEQRGERDTRLHGRRLILARIVWGVLATFELGMFAVSLPGFVTQLGIACTSSCMSQQLSAEAVKTLQHTGLSLGDYVAFSLAVTLTSALISYAIAALLVWRRSSDWMALLVSLMLLSFVPSGITNAVLLSRWFGLALALMVVSLSSQSSIALVVLAFYLFPDGRFVPHWTRWMVLLGIGVSILFIFFPAATQSLSSGILYFGYLLSLVIVQVYRYRRVSSPAQRQQTKWVVYGLAVTILLVVGLFWIPGLIFPGLGQNGSLFSSVGGTLANALSTLLPISFGVAILRYRLYDIDVLINRTLVYVTLTVTLTAILALIYIGSIIVLQSLLRSVINQNSDVAIVVSTLVIYALFQPLRSRVQSIIDRRFYRRKYDAAKIVAAFSVTLRQEVDLDQLREQLLAVVQETMQPAHVSLWLRPPAHHGNHQALWRATPSVPSENEARDER
jgi:hypothetical protein